uniref:Retrotrans_gag domain-containing protein n=1 Tax=Haemonchus contortus TaxID=6289 RepID=A0A7I4Y858_HAECO
MVELKQAMEQQFQSKKLLMAERFGLVSRSQKAGQTLQEYYAEVQKAASTCGFEKVKEMRDAMVAMVFIGGLASVETRKRLLEREELTSKEVLEMAEAVERVGKNAPHLKQGVTELGVAAIAPREPRLPSRVRGGEDGIAVQFGRQVLLIQGPEAEVELLRNEPVFHSADRSSVGCAVVVDT